MYYLYEDGKEKSATLMMPNGDPLAHPQTLDRSLLCAYHHFTLPNAIPLQVIIRKPEITDNFAISVGPAI